MPDLLLEVLSEEIPARMQAGGAAELQKQVLARLEEARLEFDAGAVKSFATPRRLALIVPGLPDVQPDIRVERKGPRVDAPEKAIQGFLKSTGLTLADCEQRETPKGPVWFAVSQEKGRPAAEVLADLLPQALAAVSWPKSMRWEASGTRWVRPIRSILCLLDDTVVPFRFAGVESDRITLGHRFLDPGPHTIADPASYPATLEAAKVMLDPEERAQRIEDEVKALAESKNLFLLDDERHLELLDENVGLVEWPVVRMGGIDPQFLDLPGPVQRSAMRTHQRYFGLLEVASSPAPHFIMVANTKTENDCAAIIKGNERVLHARLADARFFWDQDKRQTLEERVDALDGVVFHARLGSMKEKAKRIQALARSLCRSVENSVHDATIDDAPDQAARAGLLCKADLVTETVGEFPDLQGIIGHWRAADDGEPPAVCNAIADHYRPQGPSDYCPNVPVSIAVALADKLDTLAGFFAIDERPTGSKDPFALRRAAQGVIRLIIENKLRLPLSVALIEALTCYGLRPLEEPDGKAAWDNLAAFFTERVRVDLRERGYRHDLVDAVLRPDTEGDFVLLIERIEALDRFLKNDDGANLLTAYRRAANILRIEEKKDGTHYKDKVDPSLFDVSKAEERILQERINDAKEKTLRALNEELPEEAMQAMATLREPVDAFFDNVTVNCDDPALRRNRLLMLSQIRATLDRVADFSKIEG